jgi:hypothetical protein
MHWSVTYAATVLKGGGKNRHSLLTPQYNRDLLLRRKANAERITSQAEPVRVRKCHEPV